MWLQLERKLEFMDEPSRQPSYSGKNFCSNPDSGQSDFDKPKEISSHSPQCLFLGKMIRVNHKPCRQPWDLLQVVQTNCEVPRTRLHIILLAWSNQLPNASERIPIQKAFIGTSYHDDQSVCPSHNVNALPLGRECIVHAKP